MCIIVHAWLCQGKHYFQHLQDWDPSRREPFYICTHYVVLFFLFFLCVKTSHNKLSMVWSETYGVLQGSLLNRFIIGAGNFCLRKSRIPVGMIRDGPLMIWGGASGREFVLSFFFPRQLAVELFFSWPTGCWVSRLLSWVFFSSGLLSWVFFPARVAVEFFSRFCPSPPPKSLMVLP